MDNEDPVSECASERRTMRANSSASRIGQSIPTNFNTIPSYSLPRSPIPIHYYPYMAAYTYPTDLLLHSSDLYCDLYSAPVGSTGH
jgi:hypothetical protein